MIKVSRTKTDVVVRNVTLVGRTDIMFDRYPGDNDTKLEPHQKFYYLGDSKQLCIPALNVMSFLSGHNTNSAPKRLLDARKFKNMANACLSFIQINPVMIPFTREGKPIVFGKFDSDKDALSGAYVSRLVARLDKGIPNPKVRPVLPLPWELKFEMTIFPNKEIQEQQILNLLENGGIALGLGTFRGVYGKFSVDQFD